MSEESEEKKKPIVKKSLQPILSQSMEEQAKKNMVASDPSKVTQETPKDPRQRGGRRS